MGQFRLVITLTFEYIEIECLFLSLKCISTQTYKSDHNKTLIHAKQEQVER